MDRADTAGLVLPPALHGYPTLCKLIWLYVQSAPGELRVETLVQALGVSFPKATTALRHMVTTGAIVAVQPRAGRTPGQYRVAQGAELGTIRPYEVRQRRSPTIST